MPGKRELIEPHKGDKRYVRRDDGGKFKEFGRRREIAGAGSAHKRKDEGQVRATATAATGSART